MRRWTRLKTRWMLLLRLGMWMLLLPTRLPRQSEEEESAEQEGSESKVHRAQQCILSC